MSDSRAPEADPVVEAIAKSANDDEALLVEAEALVETAKQPEDPGAPEPAVEA